MLLTTWWLRKYLDYKTRLELQEFFQQYDPDVVWEEDVSHKSIISLKQMDLWLPEDINIPWNTKVLLIDPKWGLSSLDIKRIEFWNEAVHFHYNLSGTAGSRHLRDGDKVSIHVKSTDFPDFPGVTFENWEIMKMVETK